MSDSTTAPVAPAAPELQPDWAASTEAEDRPTRPSTRPTFGDRVFRILATAATSVSLLIVGVTLIFLIKEAQPALSSTGFWTFFTTNTWNASVGQFGVLGLLLGTAIIATIAMIIAVPLAVAMALFINEYAPPKLRDPLTSVIDLLAALPSLLFGMWGFFALQSRLVPTSRWLSDHLGAIPIFSLRARGCDARAVELRRRDRRRDHGHPDRHLRVARRHGAGAHASSARARSHSAAHGGG